MLFCQSRIIIVVCLFIKINYRECLVYFCLCIIGIYGNCSVFDININFWADCNILAYPGFSTSMTADYNSVFWNCRIRSGKRCYNIVRNNCFCPEFICSRMFSVIWSINDKFVRATPPRIITCCRCRINEIYSSCYLSEDYISRIYT